MDWRAHITVDPAIVHGQTCIRGTRIPVSVVLDNLADGESIQQLLESYPSLTTEAIEGAVAYAADLAQETDLPSESGGTDGPAQPRPKWR
jgi:uncharacterized protein (DUF433 family)